MDDETTIEDLSQQSNENHENLRKHKENVRSKILERIYNKNIKNDYDENKEKINENDVRNDKKDLLMNKVPLSKEWNKTLSKLLKSNSSIISSKRREGIDFFIKINNRIDDNVENNEESNISKKNRKLKRIKDKKNEEQIFDLAKPTRRIKTNFKLDKNIEILKKSERFQNEKAEIEFSNILERFTLLDPWNYGNTIRFFINRNVSSYVYRIINWCYSFIFPYDNEDNHRLSSLQTTPTFEGITNNNRSTLNLINVELFIYRNASMNEFDKNFGRLLQSYEYYLQTISISFDKNLTTLERIIYEIIHDLKNETLDEIKIKRLKDLLEELYQKRTQMIQERRSAVLNLLQNWEKALQNRQFGRYVKNKTIQLELIEDEDNEKITKYDEKQAKEEELFLEKIREQIPDKYDSENKPEIVLFRDGRQSGEPCFKSITLRYDFNNLKPEERNEEKRYFVKLSLLDQTSGSKTEILQQNHVTESLKYKRCLSLFLSPNYLIEDSLWSYQIILQDKTFKNTEFVPILSVYQVTKNSGNSAFKNDKEEILVGEVEIDKIPLWNYSLTNTKNNLFFDIKNREHKFEARIKFEAFWNLISDHFQQDSILLRKEKNFINEINNSEELETILTRIRYLSSTSIDLTFQLEQEKDLTNFKIALVHQILKKKIDLDYEKIKNRRINELSIEEKNDVRSKMNENGQFCTKHELDTNRRYELYIQRNKFIAQGQRSKLRFIPMTNVTEIFYNNILLNDNSNQDKIEKLLKFLQKSSSSYLKTSFDKKITKKINKKDRKKLTNNEQDNENDENDAEMKIYQEWLLDSDENEIKNGMNIARNAIQKLHQMNGLCSRDISLKYSDIIYEPEIESIEETGLFNALTVLLIGDNRRKLNPSRKEHKRRTISAMDIENKRIELILNIHSVSSIIEQFKNNQIYFEIICDKQIEKTSLSYDQNWNESYRFTVNFDSTKVLQITMFAIVSRKNHENYDGLKYSKNKINSSDDDDDDDTSDIKDIHICIGWLDLPLRSLLYQSKVEGIFQLATPYLVNNFQGLKSDENFNKKSKQKIRKNKHDDEGEDDQVDDEADDDDDIERNDDDDDDEEDVLNFDEYTMGGTKTSLSLFMTTDPQIDPSIQGQTLKLNTTNHYEEIELLEYCERYQKAYENNYPNRQIVTLVLNTSGQQILICRYLTPIKIPEMDKLLNNIGFSKQIIGNKMKKIVLKEKLYETILLRFVSLLESDFTLPVQIKFDVRQFLSTRIGFEFEHSFLLACWLQYLGRNAFILYGNSTLDGNVSFVIVFKEFSLDYCSENDFKIIDPRKGQEYSGSDSLLPLKAVFSIITNDNIYSNIQKNTHPSSISFNIYKTTQWLPLFTSKDKIRFNKNSLENNIFKTIQPEKLIFNIENRLDNKIHILEDKYETFIRDRLMFWRKNQSKTFTSFNRAVSENIKELLFDFEEHLLLKNCFKNIYNTEDITNTIINFNHYLQTIEDKFYKKINNQIIEIHDLIGYIITFKNTTSIEYIMRQIYSILSYFLQLHDDISISNTIEFVVSVKFHYYSANLLSGWAYIGVLLPKIFLTNHRKYRKISNRMSLPPMRKNRKVF